MYLINGKEVKKEEFNIPVENLAIWRGDGIFEAIAIHKGYLFGLDKHLERFAKSAEKMPRKYPNIWYSFLRFESL